MVTSLLNASPPHVHIVRPKHSNTPTPYCPPAHIHTLLTNMKMCFYSISFDQTLCGDAWVYSDAFQFNAFVGSSGSIALTACTSTATPAIKQATRQFISRRPLVERDLIAKTPITTPASTPASTPAITLTTTNTMACSKCGTFEKSGRVSCCAPGGAWFKNCGGARNKNVDHKWFEGVAACKRTSKANGML